MAKADNQDTGEATVELMGYQPGESSTDVPAQGEGHEGEGIVHVVNVMLTSH